MSKKEMKEQGLSKEELDIMNNQRHGPGSKKRNEPKANC